MATTDITIEFKIDIDRIIKVLYYTGYDLKILRGYNVDDKITKVIMSAISIYK